MKHIMRAVPVVVAVAVVAVVVAACGREPKMDPQLKADLDAASTGSIELAPNSAGTKVVSGIEQVRRTQAKTTAPKPRTPVTTDAPMPQETQQAAVTTEPAATVPASRPQVQPPPPGGYKSIGDVIRKAPFPINPATQTKKKP